jgi:hypothetical protein
VQAFSRCASEDIQTDSAKRETNLPSWALLRVRQFFSRGAAVNLEYCNLRIDEQIPVVAVQRPNLVHAGRRIERHEFEELLQRAMEILNARDLKAQLKTAA